MKRLIRECGLVLLLLCCWLPVASAQLGQPHVSRIVITNVGPAVASEDLIRANIHVKPGDPYVRTSVDDDIKSLYGTGYFFNIQVVDKPEAGGVVLTYILQGKFKLTHLKFEGNTKYSDQRLLKKITSKIGEPVDNLKLFSDSQEIEKMYQKSGYPRTTVKYFLDNPDELAGRSGARFEITESPKIKIVEVDFPGAKAFTQKKLRKVVKTRRHWMFSWLTRSGIFKPEQFEDDQEKLGDFYRNEGYVDFELVRTNLTNPTPRTMKVEFEISEGKQYRVGSVTFKGNLLFKTEEIVAGLKRQHDERRSKLKIGEHGLEADTGLVFKPDSLTHDIQSVEDFYGSKGYIDVRLGGGLRVNQIPNVETGNMDLEYLVEAGEKSLIEKISIRGNAKTKDKVIRRELAVAPGEVFDMVHVRLSKERLEGLQFFEKVETKPEPTVVPNRKDLIVAVEEKSTGQFQFGAGFSTIESVSGFAEVSQSNFDLFKPPYFTGGGQKFRLRVQIGSLLQDYRVSFVEPWFLNRKLRFSLDLYHSVYDYQSLNNLYNETQTGARVGLSRALGSDFLIGGISYTIESIGIIDVNNAPEAIVRDQGHAMLNRFGTSIAYDTRNNYTLPTKGQRTELRTELVGGDRNFFKIELNSAWYVKGFAEGHVLELLLKTGVAEKLSGKNVPFYDEYYLGGQNTLRGYDYRGIGPREQTPDFTSYEPIGGNTYWMGSIEYSIPVIQRLRFAVFYDIGNVSADPFSYGSSPIYDSTGKTVLGTTGRYSDNWGLGLRLDLPIGPLRLDYGIPMTHDQFNSQSGKFQFSVGFSRPF